MAFCGSWTDVLPRGFCLWHVQDCCKEAAPESQDPQLFIGEDAKRLGLSNDVVCFPVTHGAVVDRWGSMAVRLRITNGDGEDLVRPPSFYPFKGCCRHFSSAIHSDEA